MPASRDNPPAFSAPPRRISFVIGSLVVGGAESQLAMLAEELSRRGWRVDVYVVEMIGQITERLKNAGINVINGGGEIGQGSRVRKSFQLGLCQFRLLGHLIWTRPDVVHAFLPLTNFMGAVAGRMAFVRVVITSKRGLSNHQDRYPALWWLDYTANALSHVITANSKAVAHDVARRDNYPISRIVVIPNGLDFTRFENTESRRDLVRSKLGLAAGDVAIVNVANLIPYKGHRELIEAFAALAKEDPRLRLFLIGEDRGIAAALLEAARNRGVAERIVFMGHREDVPDLLSAMDVGVMASHEEGFSNAVLEKLAAGLPVVATNVGGNPAALAGMPDCELVEPFNPNDLERGLRTVITCIGEVQDNRQARRNITRERYSVNSMVDAYEQLYLSRWKGEVR